MPKAREGENVAVHSGDGLFVEDRRCHHLHYFNWVSARVWRLSDGRRDAAAIASDAATGMGSEVSEDAVRVALQKLDDADLLERRLGTALRDSAQSCWAFLRKAAVAGAAVPAVDNCTERGCTGQSGSCSG